MRAYVAIKQIYVYSPIFFHQLPDYPFKLFGADIFPKLNEPVVDQFLDEEGFIWGDDPDLAEEFMKDIDRQAVQLI